MGTVSVRDVLIVGAGPSGLAAAIACRHHGLDYLVVEQGALVDAIARFPLNMVFFTTPELLEIGDLPMTSLNDKPVRAEALKYYRRVADHYKLDIRQYQRVLSLEGSDGAFLVRSQDQHGGDHAYAAKKVILATGYYDVPNLLNVPGENLPKVIHYYKEAHPYYDHDVLVVGAKNSAAIAALELWWTGARVTLVHRGDSMHRAVKYWIKPNIENRIKNGEIPAYFHSRVVEIQSDRVLLATPGGEKWIKNDYVFAMTGYRPDFEFLAAQGVRLDAATQRPILNKETLESERPGVYLAGVIVAGVHTNEIFIENGRFHGKQIATAIARSLGSMKG